MNGVYITVRQQHRETFDTTDIVTGGGNDTGIDAVAILVNGQMVADVDELADVAANGSLAVGFVFVRAIPSSVLANDRPVTAHAD